MTSVIGFIPSQVVCVFSGSSTLSGTWTDSVVVEDREMQPKLFITQQMSGANSALVTYYGSWQSGGAWKIFRSGVTLGVSGLLMETLTDPFPFVKMAAKDSVDGSACKLNGWVVVG